MYSITVDNELVCLPNIHASRVRSTFTTQPLPSASRKSIHTQLSDKCLLLMLGPLSVTLLLASITYSASLTVVRNQWLDPYSLRPNPLYPYPRSHPSRPLGNTPIYGPRFRKDSDASPSRTRPFRLGRRQDTSETVPQELDTRPTPQSTGEPSVLTTVF